MSGLFQFDDLPSLHGLRKAAMAGVALGVLAGLSGCNDALQETRASQSLSGQMMALMQEKGVAPQSPMLIRAYKKELEFEVWKMRPDGTYVLLKAFPICRWSGQLGPKTHEGDRQSPEGFYSITPGMMNPNSAYYLSFNIGYPNAYDRAHGATGGSVMVHGICSSAGCFSMTDAQIAEIYALARELVRRRPARHPDAILSLSPDRGKPRQIPARSEHAVLEATGKRQPAFQGHRA